jgi:hypothetical protein
MYTLPISKKVVNTVISSRFLKAAAAQHTEASIEPK